MKRLIVVLYVVMLCALVVARPVAADSEGWTLWSSTDCIDWSTGCDEVEIYIPEAGIAIAQNIPPCDLYRVHVGKLSNTPGCILRVELGSVFYTSASTSYFNVDGVGFSGGNIGIRDMSDCEQFLTGVVIECYDPRALTPVYSAVPTPEPASLSAMTEAGENVMASSAATTIPMIIGLAVGMGIIVQILRVIGWL